MRIENMNTAMKRVLLGTTAVVGLGLLIPAPVFAAEPVSLSIDGTVDVKLRIVSQDDEVASGGRSHVLQTDNAGFNLKARGEAENGLVYGAKIEIDTDAGDGDVGFDELVIWFSGGWGRLELGNEDGADNTMYNHGGDLNSGAGGFDGGPGDAFQFNSVSQSSPDIAGSSDGTKITYYTPRVNGIQLGASYTPDTGALGLDSLATNVTSLDLQDHLGFGVNFVQSFDDVAIRLAAVWSVGEAEVLATDNTNAWGVGGQVGFGNFKIGAGYGDNGDSGSATGGVNNQEFFDVAVQYSEGPITVSAGYFTSSAGTGTAGQAEDDVDFFAVGAAYSVAPGLNVYAGFDVISVNQNGTGDGNDNDGTLFTIGTTMSF